MERLVSAEVHRIEFRQLVLNNANHADVQKTLFEIENSNDADELQQSIRLQNLMQESIHSTHSDDSTQSNNTSVMAPPSTQQ